MANVKVDMTTWDVAYSQGLAYAWGRMDANEPNLNGFEVSWARHWADIYAQDASRPSIQRAFEAWQDNRED